MEDKDIREMNFEYLNYLDERLNTAFSFEDWVSATYGKTYTKEEFRSALDDVDPDDVHNIGGEIISNKVYPDEE